MKDTLLYRLEYKGKGPFQEDTFHILRSTIIDLGPSSDDFGTTFLNLYDQNTRPPSLIKEFKPYLQQIINTRELSFAFTSLEAFCEGFRLDVENTGRTTPLLQFRNLLDADVGVSVNVYLARPIAQNKSEAIFIKKEDQLIEQCFTFREFINL